MSDKRRTEFPGRVLDPPAPTRLRKKRCENCVFFDAENKECHIRAAGAALVPTSTGQPSAISFYPPARTHQWCGEHKDAPPDLYETSDAAN